MSVQEFIHPTEPGYIRSPTVEKRLFGIDYVKNLLGVAVLMAAKIRRLARGERILLVDLVMIGRPVEMMSQSAISRSR